MQTNLETLSSLERRLTMAVPSEQIDKEVDERLKRLSRTVRMSGFRPGKVPLKIISQQYGPQVRSEVVGDAVQKAFSAAVTEQKLRVAGYPRIEPKQEGVDAGTLAFSATFEVYPEFKPGDVSQSSIERLAHDVADADVDKTIEILRKQRTTFRDAGRPAQVGDRVTVDFTGRIDGVEFAGGKGSGVPVVLGEGRMLADFETGLAGATAAETRTFEVKFPEDYGGKEVAGKTASFEAVVNKVEEPVLPEVDAEFARGLGVADGDLAKMREEIRGNVEREVKKRIENDLKQKVMQALVDATPVEVPRALVEMEVQRLVQSARADLESRGIKMEQLPINPEVFEAQAKRRVTLGLILAELVKANQLNPKPEDVRARVDEYAGTYEQPGEVVKWVYSEPQRLAEFEGMAIEGKVVDWVVAHAKVADKAVSFDELMEKAA
jgi:trigger factor